jgi:hypothetical protein
MTPVRCRPPTQMNEDRLVPRIGNEAQELDERRSRRRLVNGHWEPKALHARRFDHGRFAPVGVVADQVDHSLDAERPGIGIVPAYGLCASIVLRADTAKVLDRDSARKRVNICLRQRGLARSAPTSTSPAPASRRGVRMVVAPSKCAELSTRLEHNPGYNPRFGWITAPVSA